MQPTPKPNDTQPIHEQVIEDIKRRAEVGKQNYGTYLQVGNGRDSLLDAYEEAQDKALYLKQAILERDDLVMELEAAREALSQIYWKSIELGEDRGDSTINHIAAQALEALAWQAETGARVRRNPVDADGRTWNWACDTVGDEAATYYADTPLGAILAAMEGEKDDKG